MVRLHIEELLNKNNKTKYWLRKNMNITTKNLNRVINGETTSISFRYLEDFCTYLNCSLDELIEIVNIPEKEEA